MDTIPFDDAVLEVVGYAAITDDYNILEFATLADAFMYLGPNCSLYPIVNV